MKGLMQKITFYDTETTGLPVWKEPSGGENQPHLVQLSAIQCDADTEKILQRIDLIIKPDGWEISQEMTDIHGISHQMALNYGVSEPHAVMLLFELCRDSIRVAHNRTFDQRIIRIALKRWHGYFSDNDVDQWAEKNNHKCTMLMSKPIMELPPRKKWGWKNPKLEEAYKYFTGKELGDKAHSSIFDTQACMEIYFVMLKHNAPEPEPQTPCSSCGGEWIFAEFNECPHCGNVVPF